MKQGTRSNWFSIAGLLLVTPALWLIVISVLKAGFNLNGPFDVSKPILEKWGITEPVGFNINLIILFGPVIGLLLAAIQIVRLDWKFDKDEMKFGLGIQKKWFPITVAILSGAVLASLFIYMLGENCNCGG